jgi:hypothetical protein
MAGVFLGQETKENAAVWLPEVLRIPIEKYSPMPPSNGDANYAVIQENQTCSSVPVWRSLDGPQEINLDGSRDIG